VFKSLCGWWCCCCHLLTSFLHACEKDATTAAAESSDPNPPRSHMRSGLWTQVSRLGTHKKIHTQNLLGRTFILCRSGFLYKSCGSRKISQLQLNCQQNQSKTGRGMNYIILESKAFVFQAKHSSCLKDGG
jgi:hypothetical protein